MTDRFNIIRVPEHSPDHPDAYVTGNFEEWTSWLPGKLANDEVAQQLQEERQQFTNDREQLTTLAQKYVDVLPHIDQWLDQRQAEDDAQRKRDDARRRRDEEDIKRQEQVEKQRQIRAMLDAATGITPAEIERTTPPAIGTDPKFTAAEFAHPQEQKAGRATSFH
jgi:hypothetical protein